MNPVRITKCHVTLDYYCQEGLNPHPVFPQWSPWDVYPYQNWGSMTRKKIKRQFYMPVIENDYLRVVIAPDVGGRIWEIYDKIGRRQVVNYESGVISYNAGFGLNYTSGGIECNYPHGHSITTSRQREVSTATCPDGSAAIIISEFEPVWRTRWSLSYVLRPDRSFVEVRIRIYNRTPFESRHLFWNNCGFKVNDSTKFIFPEEAGSQHGNEVKSFSWPIWRGQDQSIWKNEPEALGLYMLDSQDPFFGAYDPDESYGIVHYADLADLPGKKFWSWGVERRNWFGRAYTTEGHNYGEVQSGRLVIQEHMDRVPPQSESCWSGYWFPVRDTGTFNAAGPGAVMRVEADEKGSKTNLKVSAMGNGVFPRALLRITREGYVPTERPLTLNPKRKTDKRITLEGKAGFDQKTRVEIIDHDGQTLARWQARKPRTRDSWKEVAPIQIADHSEPVGVDGLFMAAENTARDWGNHNLVPLYEKCLKLDNDHAPARIELGKIALRAGKYDLAITHLQSALKRNSDSHAAWYWYGLALRYAGRMDEARKAFELANRYDYEIRALVQLAELYMREENWHHALKHLDRLASLAPRQTRPRGLHAACLRKLGRTKQARQEIKEALAIDAQDPFLQIEALIISQGAKNKLTGKPAQKLIDQVRGHEPPLLEAACDYFAAALFEETAAAIRIIPSPGPLATLLLAYVTDGTGRKSEALKILDRACKLDPEGHCMWRLEMVEVAQWAMAQRPKVSRLPLHLGNLLMARRRPDEGIALWEKAEKLGEKHFLLHASLGRYNRSVKRDWSKANVNFGNAIKDAPEELHLMQDFASTLPGDKQMYYFEKNLKNVRKSPVLSWLLLRNYLRRNEFSKFDAYCRKVDFSVNWQMGGPHSVWVDRYVKEALELANAGNPKQAYKVLHSLKRVPDHIVIGDYDGDRDERRLYHLGWLCEQQGKTKEAREWWEKAASVEHVCAWEPAKWYHAWRARYFQILALEKLGRKAEAQAMLDGMELLALSNEIPVAARKQIIGLIERARYAPDNQKDPTGPVVEVATKAEL